MVLSYIKNIQGSKMINSPSLDIFDIQQHYVCIVHICYGIIGLKVSPETEINFKTNDKIYRFNCLLLKQYKVSKLSLPSVFVGF